jgi:ferric-dicitrate binding protein FerR (iron transport regulator)
MRFERGRSREEVLAGLSVAAEQSWGHERMSALGAALERAADALYRLSEAPLELLDAEPDFVGGVAPRSEP